VTTLFIVPLVYGLVRSKAPVDYDKKIDQEHGQTIADILELA
jgi:hypothetical protein